MVSAFVQLRWLLWKNWIVVKRRYIATPLEFLIPALIPLILLLIRQRVESSQVDNPQEFGECTAICDFPTGTNYSNLHSIAYFPDSPFTIHLMQQVVSNNRYLPRIKTARGGFGSEQEMVDFLMELNGTNPNTEYFAAGIVFTTLEGIYDRNGSWPVTIKYTIRMPATPRNKPTKQSTSNPSNWRTESIFPIALTIGPREKSKNCSADPNYQQEGFTSLQCAIDSTIIALYNGSLSNDLAVDVSSQRNPFPPYYKDYYILAIQQNFAIMLLLGFFCMVLNAVSDVTAEREDKLKETLRMMGVSSSIQWTAWIIRFTLSSVIISLLQTLLFCIPSVDHPPVVPKSDPTIFFVFLLLSALASISLGFLVASFFSSASSAAVATALVFLMSIAPYTFLQLRYGDISLVLKLSMMLISTVGMGFGGLIIGNYESLGTGAQWYNLYEPVGVDDQLTLNLVFIMLIVDIILYCTIAFYVETVSPGEFGVPQKWWFPVDPHFWFPNRGSSKRDSLGPQSEAAPVPDYANPEWFEIPRMADLPPPSVKIRELTRRFGREKVAVNALSLDLFEGHITCLLGHNGSGKTTTMFMLTGFLAPTSGTAIINECDIRRAADLAKIRQQLGLCPQHDVLFRQLSVSEHLKLFALLKGCEVSLVGAEIDNALSSVNLESKRKEYARNLSGGQKRRLSVAIALIGGSKMVILDEPTSGLDPDARRQLWDVIEKARPGRAIMLTTHFLEEADALADRVAVLSSGNLRCVGSPMFLKRTLGGGYRLNIEVDRLQVNDAVHQIVQQSVANAQLWSQTLRNELIYTLPTGQADSLTSIARVMDALEQQSSALQVRSLGLTASSMEDVFVAAGLAEEFDENKDKSGPNDNIVENYSSTSNLDDTVNRGTSSEKTDGLTSIPKDGVFMGPALWAIQFYALVVKYAITIFRSPIVMLSQLFSPLLFTGIIVAVIKTVPNLTNSPNLVLTPHQFSSPFVTAYNPSNSASPWMAAYERTITEQYPSAKYVQVPSNGSKGLVDYMINQGEQNVADYRTLYNLGAVFDDAQGKVTAYFNGDAYHAVAVSIATVYSGLFNAIVNHTTPFQLETANHPLPLSAFEQIDNQDLLKKSGFMLSLNIMFGLAIYMGCCVMQPVAERVCAAKQLQFLAGATPWVYWLAVFICQLLLLIPSAGLILVLFATTDFQAFVSGPAPFHFLLLMGLFFASAAPQNYLMSFMFSTPNRALVWLMLWNVLASQVTILAVEILSFPTLDLEDVANVCRYIFIVALPQYSAGQALEDYYDNWVDNSICTPDIMKLCKYIEENHINYTFPCCPPPYCIPGECLTPASDYLSLNDGGIGIYLVSLAGQAVVYSALLLLFDYRVFHLAVMHLKQAFGCGSASNQSSSRLSLLADEELDVSSSAVVQQWTDPDIDSDEEDIDVVNERRKVAVAVAQKTHQGLCVSNVVKRFSSSVLAVGGVSFEAVPGQCFGLLGFNGAGKTTLYRIITADFLPTQGDVFVASYSVRNQPTTAQRQIGYCPQAVSSMDGLLHQLTGRQQLLLMARLRGIRGDIHGYVSRLLQLLFLTRSADRPSKTYSGGMRRKLSTAVSLVGQPPVVLLDEPTTGMDPAARRQFWRVVDQLRRDGSTVVMTSHSMDECDLLCDKIGVMTKGRLACIGSPSHLKKRFGGGMMLVAKAANSAGLGAMKTYIEANIIGVTLKDAHLGTASYTISYLEGDKRMAQTWSELFAILERARSELGLIEDYSLSHTTLERVFLAFATANEAQASSDAATSQQPVVHPADIIFSEAL